MTNKLNGVARHIAGRNVKFLKPFWGQSEITELNTFLSDPWEYESQVESSKNFFSQSSYEMFTDSGRSAIQLALELMRLPKGSEVIIPSFACTGVIQPIINLGLIPVFADVDEQLNISDRSVSACLTPETRAIIVPAIGGLEVNGRDSIRALALGRDIAFIDDLAQSTHLVDRYVNGWSSSREIIVFSTGVGKPLFATSGGGLLCSRDLEEDIELMEIPSQPISETHARVEQFGKQYLRHSVFPEVTTLLQSQIFAKRRPERPSDVSPNRNLIRKISQVDKNVARIQFDGLDEQATKQLANANHWFDLFNSFGMSEKLTFAPRKHNLLNKYWVKSRRLNVESIARLRSALWSQGIQTENLYLPLHLRSEFRHFSRGSLSMTEQLVNSVFSLPVRANLELEDWKRIEKAIKAILTKGD